jgi:hypothetical protein
LVTHHSSNLSKVIAPHHFFNFIQILEHIIKVPLMFLDLIKQFIFFIHIHLVLIIWFVLSVDFLTPAWNTTTCYESFLFHRWFKCICIVQNFGSIRLFWETIFKQLCFLFKQLVSSLFLVVISHRYQLHVIL